MEGIKVENIILENYLYEIQIIDKAKNILSKMDSKLKSFSLSKNDIKNQLDSVISNPKFLKYKKIAKLALDGKLNTDKYRDQPIYYGLLMISTLSIYHGSKVIQLFKSYLPPSLASLSSHVIFGLLLYIVQEILPAIVGKIINKSDKDIRQINKEINDIEKSTTHGKIFKSLQVITSIMGMGFLMFMFATGAEIAIPVTFGIFIVLTIIRAVTRTLIALQNELT
jgi:hypothetical protein